MEQPLNIDRDYQGKTMKNIDEVIKAVRKQAGTLQSIKGFSNIDPVIKKEIVIIFQMTAWKLRKIYLFMSVSDIKKDMATELKAVRGQTEKIMKIAGFSDIEPRVKNEIESLFKMTSAEYSLESL